MSGVGYDETLAAFRRGDNVEAARLADLDLREATERGDEHGRVDALCMLARVALREGDASCSPSRCGAFAVSTRRP